MSDETNKSDEANKADKANITDKSEAKEKASVATVSAAEALLYNGSRFARRQL